MEGINDQVKLIGGSRLGGRWEGLMTNINIFLF